MFLSIEQGGEDGGVLCRFPDPIPEEGTKNMVFLRGSKLHEDIIPIRIGRLSRHAGSRLRGAEEGHIALIDPNPVSPGIITRKDIRPTIPIKIPQRETMPV